MKVTLLHALASDLAVVNAARVSFAKHHDEMEDSDRGLIGYLLRNGHGTPFEHGYFQFHVEAPIFVLREWQRHRIGHSYNEVSGRYVELEKHFYWPTTWRQQIGKSGDYNFQYTSDDRALAELNEAYEHSWGNYQALLRMGVAKEQARAVLPLGIYSQMYWSCNPRSLMHFCELRGAADAQQEIRDLARQAECALAEHMPITFEHFCKNDWKAP